MIDQTPIIEAGLNALGSIVRRVKKLHALRPDAAGPPYAILSNGEIPEHIESICSLQALAYGCLFDKGRRNSESPKQTKLRLERVNAVLAQCAGIEIPGLRDRGMRNALAHFDERYLKDLLAKPTATTIQDVSFSHRASISFESTSIFIRAFFFDLDTVFLFEETLKPGALKAEAEAVLARFGATIIDDDGGNSPEAAA